MPVIVNAYKNDTSLGDTLASLGEHLFGKDAAQGELLRQKTHGLRRNNEAITELQRQASTPGGVDYSNPNARAAAYGLDSPKEAFEAQRGIAANQYGAMDPRTTNATAAVAPYSSTGEAFRTEQSNAMARAKMQADTAANAAIRVAENTPVNVVINGRPTIMSKAEAIRGGHMPVLSHSDQQGVLLGQNFPNLETLPPQQQHAVGAFVPYGQTEKGHTEDLASKENIAQRSDATRAASAERMANWKPTPTVDENGQPIYVRQSEVYGKPAIIPESEEKALRIRQNFGDPSKLTREQRELLGIQEKVNNWTGTGPNGETLTGRTVDNGRTDMTTRQPIPAEARITGTNNAAATKDLITPTNTNLTHIQEKHANNADLRGLIQHATQLIDSDPFATGATGKAVDWSQRANLAAAQMGAFLGRGKDWKSGLENVKMEAASKLGPAAEHLFPDIYNPVPDQLNALYGMLTYKTAQALFGQEGRGLNIEDVRRTQEILGNAGNWLTNPQELKARLAVVDRYAQQNMANASAKINQHNALTQGAPVGGQPAPTAAPGAPEEWGRGPDGRPVRLR